MKDGVQRGANLVGMTKYRRMFKQSIEDPATFWAKQARHFLSWFRDFSHTHRGSFDTCDFDWFSGAPLGSDCCVRSCPLWKLFHGKPTTCSCIQGVSS